MDNDNKTFIIAEAGVNHNGRLDLAMKLIDAAAEAGADAVKFQTFKAENLLCRDAEKAAYQKKTTSEAESQFEMLQHLELGAEDFQQLAAYCGQRHIMFLSTPFDLESAEMLNGLQDIFKIPSGEITNLPLLRKIASFSKEIILSTGMSYMEEVNDAVHVLLENGIPAGKITVLHCNTEYPTPMADVNLRAMQTMAETLGLAAGYSDHTLGIEVAIAAVALGAKVIEKHFTLDRTMTGPDHGASLEPGELKAMVDAIRNIEMALGKGEKRPSASELANREIARKSIVALGTIHKGELLTEDNLAAKRPGTGISPMEWDTVAGQYAKRDFRLDEEIEI